jgi:hypothetical protein
LAFDPLIKKKPDQMAGLFLFHQDCS